MAAKKKSSLAKNIQNELTCPICLDRFKRPKMLPCLHSFCADCLQHLIARSPKKVSCPECRVEHAVPSKGFINHFLLAKLVEHLTVHEAEKDGADVKMVCGSGVDSNAASGWCVNCHSYLCHQCMDLHERQKMSKNHKTMTLAEVKEGGLSHVYQKLICSEHEGQEMKLYCKTCRDVICRDCTIVTHKGHEYIFIKDAIEEIVHRLQQLLGRVEEKDGQFQKCITAIAATMTETKENIVESEKQVNKYFDEYIAKLQHHRALLLDHLHCAKMQNEKILVAEKEDLEFTQARLTSAIAFTKQLLSSGNTSDIAFLSKQASEQLQSLARLQKQPALKLTMCSFEQKGEPFDSHVNIERVWGPTFPCPPKEVPHGLNEIVVCTDVKPIVSIATNCGKQCKVTGIASTGPTSWRVTYIIPAPPLIDSVHITAQTPRKKTIMIPCTKTLALGTKVVPGSDWKQWYSYQGVGIVVDYFEDGVYVQWKNNTDGHYFKSSCFQVKVEM